MNYQLQEGIATITFDDGKANVVGHAFLDHINNSLDRAESEGAKAVILKGREGMFSGGFDLKEFEKGIEEGMKMVDRGFELLIRLNSFPLPTIAACTGHGIAMGAFIIMSCDYRLAARGKFKLSLPETAIGMDLPPLLMELTRSRINNRYLNRAALQSEPFQPDAAVEVGFIDEAVDLESLDARSLEIATKLGKLPAAQYATNKLSINGPALDCMRTNLDALRASTAS